MELSKGRRQAVHSFMTALNAHVLRVELFDTLTVPDTGTDAMERYVEQCERLEHERDEMVRRFERLVRGR